MFWEQLFTYNEDPFSFERIAFQQSRIEPHSRYLQLPEQDRDELQFDCYASSWIEEMGETVSALFDTDTTSDTSLTW